MLELCRFLGIISPCLVTIIILLIFMWDMENLKL